MNGDSPRSNPTVQLPSWDFFNDHPMANIHSPFSVTPGSNAINFNDFPVDNLTAFQRYLPSNTSPEDNVLSDTDELDIPADTFSCDQFRMYEFKVTKCARARSHDWTECPYAHPGEKALRRDPRKFRYSGSACPEFRKGMCKKGDACEYAHGVFECWLHPARYRTQPCKDGTQCRRRVCFFAHTADQLRVLPHSGESYDGSPARLGCNSPRMMSFDTVTRGRLGIGLSPTSILHSPPLSPPAGSPAMSPSRICLTDSMRNLQIGNRGLSFSLPSWGVQMGSPPIRPGFISMPLTPSQNPTSYGPGVFDLWGNSSQEEPIMERVESGKDLRARMYAKLSKENSLDSLGPGTDPGFGWGSELVK